jgi:hypothetical protein
MLVETDSNDSATLASAAAALAVITAAAGGAASQTGLRLLECLKMRFQQFSGRVTVSGRLVSLWHFMTVYCRPLHRPLPGGTEGPFLPSRVEQCQGSKW